MSAPRPQRRYVLTSNPGGPPPLTPLDIEIGRNQGSSVGLEARPARLQETKHMPIPTLSKRIEELTRENGHLRQEVGFYQKMQSAVMLLQEDAEQVIEKLSLAIMGFRQAQKEAEDDLLRLI
jgi:hypothetical protein